MTLKSAPYYWVQCDNCGADAEYGDFSAWREPDHAIDGAIDSEWTTDGEKHHCQGCPSIAKCERCGKPAGEEALERDNHCEACWPEVEAEAAKRQADYAAKIAAMKASAS